MSATEILSKECTALCKTTPQSMLSHTANASFDFWSGLKVFTEKPHLLNKRICGAEYLLNATLPHSYKRKYEEDKPENCDISPYITLFNNLKDKHFIDNNYDSSNSFLDTNLSQEEAFIKEFQNQLALKNILLTSHVPDDESLENILPPSEYERKIVVRRLLPKDIDRHRSCIEMLLIDGVTPSITFVSTSVQNRTPLAPVMPFTLTAEDDHLRLQLLPSPSLATEQKDVDDSGAQWLQQVFPRVVRWCEQSAEEFSSVTPSLQHVSLVKYNMMYNQLKKKYAKHLIENWPERTDPLKNVYEDIGIASYLLLLWENCEKPQKFYDLGCGNGVLVYLLTKEGHRGMGFDIKKRGIWKLLEGEADLREVEVSPHSLSVFDSDTDWLIGNHSDELTPWLAVMASQLSYTCKYFVLPCCTFDFTAKFIRRVSNKSQYGDYLSYVEEVGQTCGFLVAKDKLRIASTKRVCFVGSERSYREQEWKGKLREINTFVEERTRYHTSLLTKAPVSSDDCSYVTRPKDQLVQNCTKVDRKVQQDLVKTVVDIILKRTSTDSDLSHSAPWSRGSLTKISDVAKLLTTDQLRELKKQCKGLQTLCRNHHMIFRVEKGNVMLRVPLEVESGAKRRQRPCWFFNHHPQGCPNGSDKCLYLHTKM